MEPARVRAIFAGFEEYKLGNSDASWSESDVRGAFHKVSMLLMMGELPAEAVEAVLDATGGLTELLNDCPRQLLVECLELVAKLFSSCDISKHIDASRLIQTLLAVAFGGGLTAEDGSVEAGGLSSLLGCVDQLVQCKRTVPADVLGDLLGLARCYMFYGLPGWSANQLRSLYPQPNTPHETPVSNSDQTTYTEASRSIRDASGKKVRSRRAKPRWTMQLVAEDAKDDGGGAHTSDEGPTRARLLAESSASDSEGGGACSSAERERRLRVRVRQMALVVLYSTVSYADRRQLLGYWPALTPDSAVAPAARTLSTVVLRDPASRCRLAAATVLCCLLTASRPLLRGVDELVAPPASYTPYSFTLAALLRELHRYLLLALLAERNAAARTALLHALTALLANTPYQKMRPGLLTRVSRHVRALLAARDHTVKVLALDVLISMISTAQPLPEVLQLLRKPTVQYEPTPEPVEPISLVDPQHKQQDDELEFSDPEEEAEGELKRQGGQGIAPAAVRSWLWVRCRAFVLRQRLPGDTSWSTEADGDTSNCYYPPQLRAQAMRALCLLCRSYLPVVAECLSELTDLLERCMQDESDVVRLHSVRLLECVGTAAAACSDSGVAAVTTPAAAVDVYPVWQRLLSGPLIGRLAGWNESAALHAGLCHALSTIGAGVYERLPRDRQLLCVTLLLPLADAESVETAVCSAAVRALGVFVPMPSLCCDAGFLLDVADAACAAARHRLLAVRANAIWTLANLSDTLQQRSFISAPDDEDAAGDALLPVPALASLIEVALHAAGDLDKVRINAVRALGNLLRHLDASQLRHDAIRQLVEPCVTTLCDCLSYSGKGATQMKVRWNACYAMSSLMKNELLQTSVRQAGVIETLCKLCKNCYNFKVRTNAALALSAGSSRAAYADKLPAVWTALLEALESAQNISDLNEFQHRDALLRQICLSLCHLASLLDPGDVTTTLDSARAHWDTAAAHLQRIPITLTPECSGPLLAARAHIHGLSVPADQKRQLLELFDSKS